MSKRAAFMDESSPSHSSRFSLPVRVFFVSAFVLVFAVGLRAQSTFMDRTPAYLYDRYGSPKSSQTLKAYSVYVAKRGSVSVAGDYEVKEYLKDDLRLVAVFALPSLKLVSAKITLRGAWTEEQVQAALDAYGEGWRIEDRNIAVRVWRTPDGAEAVNMLTWVEFFSPSMVEAARKVAAEADRKRKEVPTF